MVIKNPEISIQELMTFIPGPDFPTGGVIFGTKGIKRAYHTGTGNVILRAKYDIEEKKKALEILINHYSPETTYNFSKKMIDSVAIIKITINSFCE